MLDKHICFYFVGVFLEAFPQTQHKTRGGVKEIAKNAISSKKILIKHKVLFYSVYILK
jgi:hypothetical protein